MTDDGVVLQGPGGRRALAADTVVSAFGVRPSTALTDSMARLGDKVHAVGDCVSPRKVGDAINDAFDLAVTL